MGNARSNRRDRQHRSRRRSPPAERLRRVSTGYVYGKSGLSDPVGRMGRGV